MQGVGKLAAIMRKLLLQFFTTALPVILLQNSLQADDIAFRQATEFYQQSEWQQAAALFAKCANDITAPTNQALSLFYRGECLMQLGEYSTALEQYQLALTKQLPSLQTIRAKFRTAEAHWLLGNTKAAKSQLTNYVEQYQEAPSIALANSYLAEIQATEQLAQAREEYNAQNYDLALTQFRNLAANSTVQHVAQQAQLAAGWTLWKLERFQEIEPELKSLATQPQWKTEFLYLVGLAHYAERDWPTAIEHLTQAATSAKEHTSADAITFYLGECHFHAEQRTSAATWFQQVTQSFPNSRWATEAQTRLNRLNRVTEENSSEETSPLQLAAEAPSSPALSKTPKPQPASTLELSPAEKLLDIAVGLERDGRFDPALTTYNELLKNHPDSNATHQALLRAARLHAKLEQNKSALKLYQEFLSANSGIAGQVEVLAELAWLAVRLKNTQDASNYFEQIQAEFPQTTQAATAAYWLALHCADKQDYQRAHQYLDWLIAKHPTPTDQQAHAQWEKAICLKCQLAASTNQWDTIIKLLEKYGTQLTEQPNQAQVTFWLAESQFRTQNYQQAQVGFEKLKLQLAGIQEPWVAMVPLRHAQLAARRQRWSEALKRLNELQQQHPEFELDYEVDYLRGRALAGRAEMSAARESYNLVLANPKAQGTETAAMAQWMIGETYFHQHNYTLAREVYLRVIEEHTQTEWQARAALQAGKCWELEGQWEKAKVLYSTALKHWRGSESEQKLQSRLKWATNQVTKRI